MAARDGRLAADHRAVRFRFDERASYGGAITLPILRTPPRLPLHQVLCRTPLAGPACRWPPHCTLLPARLWPQPGAYQTSISGGGGQPVPVKSRPEPGLQWKTSAVACPKVRPSVGALSIASGCADINAGKNAPGSASGSDGMINSRCAAKSAQLLPCWRESPRLPARHARS